MSKSTNNPTVIPAKQHEADRPTEHAPWCTFLDDACFDDWQPGNSRGDWQRGCLGPTTVVPLSLMPLTGTGLDSLRVLATEEGTGPAVFIGRGEDRPGVRLTVDEAHQMIVALTQIIEQIRDRFFRPK